MKVLPFLLPGIVGLMIIYLVGEVVFLTLRLKALDDRARRLLFRRLWEIARQMDLSIEFSKDFKDAAGIYILNKRKIVLHPEFADDPFLFAHEIGHHIGVNQDNDETDRRANLIGRQLIESLLPWWRRRFGKWVLDIYFEC